MIRFILRAMKGSGVFIKATKHSDLSVLEKLKDFQSWDLQSTSSNITEYRKQQ